MTIAEIMKEHLEGRMTEAAAVAGLIAVGETEESARKILKNQSGLLENKEQREIQPPDVQAPHVEPQDVQPKEWSPDQVRFRIFPRKPQGN